MLHPKIPSLPDFPEVMLIGFQNFPFHGKPIYNFILQGAVVFLFAAVAGFIFGYSTLH
jgi:hypothetical protein